MAKKPTGPKEAPAAPVRTTKKVDSEAKTTSAPRKAKVSTAAEAKAQPVTKADLATGGVQSTPVIKKTKPHKAPEAPPARARAGTANARQAPKQAPEPERPADVAMTQPQSMPRQETPARASDAPAIAPTEAPPEVAETTAQQPLVTIEPEAKPEQPIAATAEPEQPEEPAETTAPPSAPEPEPEPEVVHEPPPEPPPAPSRPSLFIVHITPELAGVAKVGGLADVVFGLSRELAIRGNHVEIVLPKYASMRYDQIYDLHEVYQDLWVPWYDGAVHCTVFFGFVHGRKCFFIEPHSQDNFFNRGGIYGFRDDVLRYAFFSRAAIEFLWKAGKHPDIIHCHDWQTALVPVFLFEMYQRLGMMHPRVCLTIHNFAHQGVTGAEALRAAGLHPPERYLDHTRLGDARYPQAINLLKGGIVYSNFVTTVSPRYAFETKDQGQGFGLEPTLHTHQIKYGGVVNGVDYEAWNPELDRHIPVHYGLDSIDRKYDNKRALRHRLMLADNEKAMVAFIGRLDPQKGLDLVRHAIFYTLERGAQFVLLGSSPDERINADFWGLKQMLNDSPDCHLEIGFDEDLSHLIYAGADMMLVPSQFEPCGLTQLISLRYGTIPVVRAVGGLADTVFDKDHSSRPMNERNGYVFDNYDNRGLESALGRAIACYNDFPEHFRELIGNAMRTDYSWNRPGQDYLNIYDYIRDS
ncbi:glycogen synthase GlgA [Thiocystis violacea]|uniref:glycogen synthase GlgA n=1 Tax=Thiocystis violacea TaxID=13725 RepID=UPI0019065BC9|nr:glycogen synthase GlgA [Thiocystis violacea]MBK1722358.1 glycogen synthase [Thiocystis violacea]